MKHLRLYESNEYKGPSKGDNSFIVVFVNGNELGGVLLPNAEAEELCDYLNSFSIKNVNTAQIINVPNSNENLYIRAEVGGTNVSLVDYEELKALRREEGKSLDIQVTGGFIYAYNTNGEGLYLLDLRQWTSSGYRGKKFTLIDPWDNIKTLEIQDLLNIFETSFFGDMLPNGGYL